MTLQKNVILLVIALVLATTAHVSTGYGRTGIVRSLKTTQLKVGITEYAKIQRTSHNYERLFRELAASTDSGESVTFQFAVGTYGEVRDWFNKGLIDIAILSAMPVGDLLLAGESDNLERAYIGDLSVSTVRKQSLLNLFGDKTPDPHYYRPKCIFLRSDQKLTEIAKASDPFGQLTELWKEGSLRLLFVRPYSLSGYIVPITVLKAHGIDPLSRQDWMDFTYDHEESLKQLVERGRKEPQIHYLAFVHDDAPTGDVIDIRELDWMKMEIKQENNTDAEDYRIPREIVLANYHQEREEEAGKENKFTKNRSLMGRLFANWVKKVENGDFERLGDDEPRLRFRVRSGWKDDYKQVTDLLKGFSLPKELLYKSRLDDLLDDVLNTNPSRLALVLSGGGAKCAYQAGAIVEIENRIKKKLKEKQDELRRNSEGKSLEDLQPKLDSLEKKLRIDLVVGTSGGAVNALLAAMEVTKHNDAPDQLSGAWRSFKQEQFLQPSTPFRRWFGFCFAVLQAVLIIIAVLLFGRQSMNWPVTMVVLFLMVIVQYPLAWYFGFFGFERTTVSWFLGGELLAIYFIALLVFVVSCILNLRYKKRSRKTAESKNITKDVVLANSHPEQLEEVDPCCETAVCQAGIIQNPLATPVEDHDHWRKLTVVLLVCVGIIEGLVANVLWLQNLGKYLPDAHWIGHLYTAVILISSWSYPYPFLISVPLFILGWNVWPLRERVKVISEFDWLKWRGRAVGWTSILLVFFWAFILLRSLFIEPSPSEVEGIEKAFVDKVPNVISKTVSPGFSYPSSPDDETHKKLESISRQIMANDLLKRDLVITSSKLPVTETAESLPVNSLPDDLYFYFRTNTDDRLKPPPDKSFVPLKYNKNTLLDVVIGSSTIYPIFPARHLQNIFVGNEDTQGTLIPEITIIDGGFIHNIPIEAATLWGASHIIVIEASPARRQRDPNVFWDHTLNAFGYLFSQAQQTDAVGPKAEAFVLRPSSNCEKLNSKTICTEKDGAPEPDMDTFDFSQSAADHAFKKGVEDVRSQKPLFVKIPGSPNFQGVLRSASRTRSRRVR